MAAGMRAEARQAGEVGKQCPKQDPNGCKLAHSEFVETKKGILQQAEGDVMKERVGVLALGKAWQGYAKPLRWPGYEDTGGGRR